jgi:hypothetical protein
LLKIGSEKADLFPHADFIVVLLFKKDSNLKSCYNLDNMSKFEEDIYFMLLESHASDDNSITKKA